MRDPAIFRRLSRTLSVRLSPSGIPAGIGAAFLLACATPGAPTHEAPELDSFQFRADRSSLTGKLTTVSGYLVWSGMIGDNLCLKVLVDETLRHAPDRLIAFHGKASRPPPENVASRGVVERRRRGGEPGRAETPPQEKTAAVSAKPESARSSWMQRLLPEVWSARVPVDPWMVAPNAGRSLATSSASSASEGAPVEETPAPLPVTPSFDLAAQLVLAEEELIRSAPPEGTAQAVVVQACRHPPTRANRKAAKHALEWLKPLLKPERIAEAPTLASLRRELQLFYLERSRTYGWTQLAWEEVRLTGVILDPNQSFEDEVIGGVDMIAYAVGVHDPQRDSWLFVDLTFNDNVAKEMVFSLFGEDAPNVLKRTGAAALRGALP